MTWRRLAVVVGLCAVLLPSVALASSYDDPWLAVGVRAAVVPTASFGGTFSSRTGSGAAVVRYVGHVLVDRAPVTGDLLPYVSKVQGYNGYYSRGSVSSTVSATYSSAWKAQNIAWAPEAANYRVDLYNVPGANAAHVAVIAGWALGSMSSVSFSPVRITTWSLDGLHNVNAVFAGGVNVKITGDAGGWINPSSCTSAQVETLYNLGKGIVSAGDAHVDIPMALTSDVVHPQGFWQYQAAVVSRSTIGIANSLAALYRWGLMDSTAGIDFGVVHEPQRKPAAAAGTMMQYFFGSPGSYTLRTGDTRGVVHKGTVKAWGGRNDNGTYWWSYSASWSYEAGLGLFSATAVTTGTVSSSAVPASLRVQQSDGSTGILVDPAGVWSVLNGSSNGAIDYTPGMSPAVLQLDTDWDVWAGYRDALPSASPDSWAPDPTGVGIVVPAEPTDTWGSSGATETIDTIAPSWIPGWGLIASWLASTWATISGKLGGAIGGAVGVFMWPFTALGGLS